MIKKLVILSVVVFGIGSVISYAGGPFKYARTWVSSIMQSAEDSVPRDVKIDHARKEVAKLGKEVRRCMTVIAQQQVEVEQLQRNIGRHQAQLTIQKKKMIKLRNALKTENATYVYSGYAYTEGEVRSDLRTRLSRFKAGEDTLKRDQQILSARRNTLIANEKRLHDMVAAKKQLEVQVEQLEARNKAIQAAKVTSELEFDDSQLARTRTLLRKLDTEMNVDEKLMRQEGKIDAGSIPVDTKPAQIETEDITEEIDSLFNGKGTNAEIASTGKTASK